MTLTDASKAPPGQRAGGDGPPFLMALPALLLFALFALVRFSGFSRMRSQQAGM